MLFRITAKPSGRHKNSGQVVALLAGTRCICGRRGCCGICEMVSEVTGVLNKNFAEDAA